MKKRIQLIGIFLIIANSIFAQECFYNPKKTTDYVVSGNFTQKNSNDKVINDVVMLSNLHTIGALRINTLTSDGSGDGDGKRIVKKGVDLINYDLANVNGRMVRGDFDNDGHIDDFILINKTGVSSMRFDLFKSNGASDPVFTQSSVFTLNGYDPDKITGRVVSGDFDNDGYWDDIAAFYDYGNGETRIHTFRSNASTFLYSGSAGWWSSTGYNATKTTDRVVSGDFDRDGSVDDIAAFYDYGNGETRIHVWLSGGTNFTYQSSVGWWGATGYDAAKVSKRVLSLNIDRDGTNYDDIAVFYEYENGKPKLHVFESNGSSFDYSGPSEWWSGSKISTSTVPNADYKASFFSGKIVEYDSRRSSLTQGKPSDIIGFYNYLTSSYLFWKSKKKFNKSYIDYSEPQYCDGIIYSKNASLPIIDKLAIKAYPNPTKSFTVIEIPKLLIDDTSRIEVHNLYGRLVLSNVVKSSSVKIDLSKQKPGVYIVKVIGRKSSNVLKIVKD
ncbi:T9SS type A sorting domain-containing protein [Tenacibaculum ovolyticum]|uniref:T9SS type A sorting domain-containing protein n=1 Tax=Tenacibaculum ovolyticum TaxID=104270 RepID=UPI0022F3E80F|nr:T9SS type A sorting domain-containing protein [Tenacibaculum ovolyticum]WBX78126.1 T9SS type A sorting domain-containing protein [Tenacibaculum ovolyticum]